MAFSRPASSQCFDVPDQAPTYFAARVMPMGWLLAVSAMQHVGRRLVLESEPVGAGIRLPDLRGDHVFPLELPWGP